MKKSLIAANLFLLAVMILFSCNPKASVKKPELDEVAEANNCLPRSLSVPLTERDGGSIDAFVAKRMSENYAADPFKGFISGRAPVSRIDQSSQDARSVWFDLRRFKALISSIENSVCENNCETPLKLGIRIYFAKYDPVLGTRATDDDLKSLPSNYANRHTVFFVATYDLNGEHVDFDPFNVGNNKCRPTPFRKLLENAAGKFKVSSLGQQIIIVAAGDSTVDNHGDLMPPPSGTGIFPTGGN